MGCVNSKKAITGGGAASPAGPYVHSVSRRRSNGNGNSLVVVEAATTAAAAQPSSLVSSKGHSSGCVVSRKSSDPKQSEEWKKGNLSMRIGVSYRAVEAEQNAAGWPSWLTSVASEAIHGWVPLKNDSFEKLEKIGQGTYSSVFKAREVETGRMVALKKVRMDSIQPESIRFMAREIIILRTLDHPNVMKLEGIITSQVSNSIYLVFEYMEHDLAGLVSNADIKFTESQIKCYMRQLLSGMEHCHLRGIMHRDIKVSNILVNNEGVLKIGDFGLANTISPNNKHPLTSRVVTLWYRPPELLMGSTNYGVSVDLWSVGCVFAELFLGKPILKGRTEVEQLHKIFKLCGSPPEEYWKKSKLPLATMFKPQTTYESSLWERCKGFPPTAVNLIETLLAVDPADRGTASSALMSEYFNAAPHACNPSLLPKYPPSKEMDARNLDEMRRKKHGGKVPERDAVTSARPRRVQKVQQLPHVNKPASKEESQYVSQNDDKANARKGRVAPIHKEQQKHLYDAKSDTQRVNTYNGYSAYSGHPGMTASSGFTFTKRRKQEASSVLSDGSRSNISALDPTFAKGTYDLSKHGIEVSERRHNHNMGHREYDDAKHVMQRHQGRNGYHESFDVADIYHSNNVMEYDHDSQANTEGHDRTYKNDESLHWNENNVRQAGRRSRLGREQ